MTTFNTISQKLEQGEILQKEKMHPKDQSVDVLVDEISLRSELKELLAVIIFALLSTVLMIHLDAFDRLYRFSRTIDSYDFDEIAVFLPSFWQLDSCCILIAESKN